MSDLRKYVTVVSAPAVEPVTRAEAKLWLRVESADTDQDDVIDVLITAMREYAEELTGRAFAERTLELRMDRFPADGGVIELPYPPLRSVTSITYIDSTGVTQTLDSSPTGWQEDNIAEPGRVMPLSTTTGWPDTITDMGAVRIRYVAGYPSTSAIPKKVRVWMQQRISTLFENREQLVTGTIVSPFPRDYVDGLLDGLRTQNLFA